ncbi:MAG: transglutaminase family protein [Magnetococcales bacterium]|nr:transglutaminase family protein [Magnetococcales bacterium]
MTIRVAIRHQTHYQYDRATLLLPHVFRLRPAAHCRTPIRGYTLRITPANHFLNWQQDPFGNFLARVVFQNRTRSMHIDVEVIADLTVINPFDFFIEESAEFYPFRYDGGEEQSLRPYLEVEKHGPWFHQWLATVSRQKQKTVDFLVELNQQLWRLIRYTIRMEPGVQSCEETLSQRSGSCRDTAWLLVQTMRHLGLACRFVSGYLVQLKPDVASLDGPSGPERDFTDLHAWAEVYVPGAGWIGLDPTSGLFAGEGHIPLACTPHYRDAAPIIGDIEPCESQFSFDNQVVRILEQPRVTKPYSDEQWMAIQALGQQVDEQLVQQDVRLTMGGEPTFVAMDHPDDPEWNFTADSAKKRQLAGDLLRRLQRCFAPGGLLHYGQGKWYPGEPLPRWRLSCFWRQDGQPLWHNPALLAIDDQTSRYDANHAKQWIDHLATALSIERRYVLAGYEDPFYHAWQEQHLPVDTDPLAADLTDALERQRLARVLSRGLNTPAGFVLPLQWHERRQCWCSSHWPLRQKRLFLLPGDSPVGLRLPIDSLPAESASVIHTALCVEPRHGQLHVFLPPVELLEQWCALVAVIESVAAQLQFPLVLEGYDPPQHEQLSRLLVTPDPGVIEVNIHPAASWHELERTTTILYQEARLARLATEKFMLDGRHSGTGGGNHVTIGGPTATDSPLLRRPDLLRSLITYWQHHPGLSYLFSGQFIGPTSQAPRIDEARMDALYELEIAFQQMPTGEVATPWLVDRLLRHLLVDLTGNTHRAEFCIDKLYSPDGPAGRLGLVELRAFEMPPHAHMSLVQMLLLRGLIAWFWQQPYHHRLVRWGTELHDRFMLPYYVMHDVRAVLADLRRAGLPFQDSWLDPFLEFRFPRYGSIQLDTIELELRMAIEPWPVLGEEVTRAGTARFVDSSMERVQVLCSGLTEGRYVLTCNGRRVPLHATARHGQAVTGVRYRAWKPASALHPTIGVHTPLVFDVIDSWNGHSIGGCSYHVAHPGGQNYQQFPINSYEAEARRTNRFQEFGHTPGVLTPPPESIRFSRFYPHGSLPQPMEPPPEEPADEYPHTLDLRCGQDR